MTSANGNVKTGKILTRLIKTLPQLIDAAATVERDPEETDAIGQRSAHLVAAYAGGAGTSRRLTTGADSITPSPFELQREVKL